MKKVLSIIAILALVFSVPALPEAKAATLTYDNAGGGGNNDWANVLNWLTGVVAGTSDDALITADVASISTGVASVNSAILAAERGGIPVGNLSLSPWRPWLRSTVLPSSLSALSRRRYV